MPLATFKLPPSVDEFDKAVDRFFEEHLRIDPAHELWGMRLGAWVSLVLFLASTLFFIWWQLWDRHLPGRWQFSRGREGPKRPTMAVPRGRR